MKSALFLVLTFAIMSNAAQAESLRCAGRGGIYLADESLEYANVMYTLDASVVNGKIVQSKSSPRLVATLESGFPLPVYFSAKKFKLVRGRSLLLKGAKDETAFTIRAAYDANTETYEGALEGNGVKGRKLLAPTVSCSLQ